MGNVEQAVHVKAGFDGVCAYAHNWRYTGKKMQAISVGYSAQAKMESLGDRWMQNIEFMILREAAIPIAAVVGTRNSRQFGAGYYLGRAEFWRELSSHGAAISWSCHFLHGNWLQ